MEQNTTSVVIEQQGENKKRGALAVILAVAFVAMLGIGSTFAYLTWSGNQTPNRFTIDSALTGDVVEPAWVNGVKTSAGEASDGAAIPVNADQTKVGADKAVEKDPYVVNTSKRGKTNQVGNNGYAMIRLTFQQWEKVTSTGEDDTYTEQGYWKQMDAATVKELLNTYSFTKDSSAVTTAFNLGDGWSIVKKDGTSVGTGAVTAAAAASAIDETTSRTSIHFLYSVGIKSVGSKITTYPAAQTTATAGATTTTSLFKYVVQTQDETTDPNAAYTNFTGAIKGSSQNPGWRVLVDCSLSYCGDDMTATPTGNALTGLITAVDNIDVTADGSSPKKTADGKGTYGYLDGNGSGFAAGVNKSELGEINSTIEYITEATE